MKSTKKQITDLLIDASIKEHLTVAEPQPKLDESLSEKMSFLGNTELFKELPLEALKTLAGKTRMVFHPRGYIIRNPSRADDGQTVAIDGLYIIKTGAAKVTKKSEYGDAEAVVAILGNGNWFGEIGLLDGLSPSANVTTMSPMESFFLPRTNFLDALDKNPEIAVAMLPALGRMVRTADQWISQLL